MDHELLIENGKNEKIGKKTFFLVILANYGQFNHLDCVGLVFEEGSSLCAGLCVFLFLCSVLCFSSTADLKF